MDMNALAPPLLVALICVRACVQACIYEIAHDRATGPTILFFQCYESIL